MKKLLLILLLALATNVSAQRLTDSTRKQFSDQELRDIYLVKSKDNKTGGYIFIGISAATMAGAFALAENATLDEVAGPFFLGLASIGTFAVGFAKLSKGARYKGMADMIGNYPDPSAHAVQLKKYQNKAKVNTLVAWSLLAAGTITTYAINTNGAEGNGARYGGLVLSAASIPFFIAASNSKGRVSILTRTEKINHSALQGTGAHRTIGIALPIGH